MTTEKPSWPPIVNLNINCGRVEWNEYPRITRDGVNYDYISLKEHESILDEKVREATNRIKADAFFIAMAREFFKDPCAFGEALVQIMEKAASLRASVSKAGENE